MSGECARLGGKPDDGRSHNVPQAESRSHAHQSELKSVQSNWSERENWKQTTRRKTSAWMIR